MRQARSLLLAVAVVVACGGSTTSTDDPTTAGAPPGDGALGDGGVPSGSTSAGRACTTDAECGTGGVCDPSSHACACGGMAVGSNEVAPNVLLVEDRSCSMTDKAG